MSVQREHIGLTPTVPVTHLPDQSEQGFLGNLSSACRMLRSTRLRCSLFGVTPLGMSARSAAARLASRLGSYGLVGILPGGKIGFLHLDRCLVSEKGDEAITARVRRQVTEVLGAGSVKRIVALHYWTDEMTGSDDLLQKLEDRAFGERVSKSRPASAISSLYPIRSNRKEL